MESNRAGRTPYRMGNDPWPLSPSEFIWRPRTASPGSQSSHQDTGNNYQVHDCVVPQGSQPTAAALPLPMDLTEVQIYTSRATDGFGLFGGLSIISHRFPNDVAHESDSSDSDDQVPTGPRLPSPCYQSSSPASEPDSPSYQLASPTLPPSSGDSASSSPDILDPGPYSSSSLFGRSEKGWIDFLGISHLPDPPPRYDKWISFTRHVCLEATKEYLQRQLNLWVTQVPADSPAGRQHAGARARAAQRAIFFPQYGGAGLPSPPIRIAGHGTSHCRDYGSVPDDVVPPLPELWAEDLLQNICAIMDLMWKRRWCLTAHAERRRGDPSRNTRSAFLAWKLNVELVDMHRLLLRGRVVDASNDGQWVPREPVISAGREICLLLADKRRSSMLCDLWWTAKASEARWTGEEREKHREYKAKELCLIAEGRWIELPKTVFGDGL